MIYFDNAATSLPKPPTVAEAMCAALNRFGNPSRAAHSASLDATRCVELTRTAVAGFFGCRPERVAFTKNATEALNIAINSVDGHIVTSEAEHNSVLRPVFRRGDLGLVPVDAAGRYTLEDVAKALRPETAAVVLSHGSNLTGDLAPVAEVGNLCRERDLLFILDAAQSAGLVDIDMDSLRVDALCFSGHKSLLGPQGTGGICIGPRFRPRPLLVGGTGMRSFETEHPPDLPNLLEAGTQNSHGLAGLAAGLAFVRENRPRELLAAANRLTRMIHDGLKDNPAVVFYGDPAAAERLPILALNLGEFASEEVARELSERWGIAVRAGAHCAPLMHRCFGTAGRGIVRLSPSSFNTEAEAETVLFALRDIAARA